MSTPEFVLQPTPYPNCKIKVLGIGGAGCNAVNSMLVMGIPNVEFYALNTDLQHLQTCACPNKIQIGKDVTVGLGCGSNPELGEKSAMSSKEEIMELLKGADMVFITAGMGGGTGTGGAPFVASLSREMGILTVAFVTKPFNFEGPQKMRKAESGIEKLRSSCDSIIVMSNERLLESGESNMSLSESFDMTNNLLAQGVKSIAELISLPALINVDFADIRAIMGDTGGAVIGIGEGKGEKRSVEAVRKACSSPLLEKMAIDGAKGVLISFTVGNDVNLKEINEAGILINEVTDPDANIIFGVRIDDKLQDIFKVVLIATGFHGESPISEKGKEDNVGKLSVFSGLSSRTNRFDKSNDDVKKNNQDQLKGSKSMESPLLSTFQINSNGGNGPGLTGDSLPFAAPSNSKLNPERTSEVRRNTPPPKEVLGREPRIVGKTRSILNESDKPSVVSHGDKFNSFHDHTNPLKSENIESSYDVNNATDSPVLKTSSPVSTLVDVQTEITSNIKTKKESKPHQLNQLDENAHPEDESTSFESLNDKERMKRDATKPEIKSEDENLEIPAFLRRRRGGFKMF